MFEKFSNNLINFSQFPNAPYVGYYKFSAPAIVLRDPDLVKNVLIRDFDSFHGNDQHISEKLDPLLAVNPFLNVGEKWKRGRNALVPVFSAAKVRKIVLLIIWNTYSDVRINTIISKHFYR